MSFPHPDMIEDDPRRENGITDNYMHPGWNHAQAWVVIGMIAAGILALITTQCTKTHAQNESLKKQSQSEKIIPENSLNQ